VPGHASPDGAADAINGCAARLPVPPEQAEAIARILDHLSEEIRESAGMLRCSDHDSVPAGAPGCASCDQWSIVDLVTHDLSRRGIKSRFGPEADLRAAAHAAAQLLEALGVRPVVPPDDSAVPGAASMR
jgi:hypothetical protein